MKSFKLCSILCARNKIKNYVDSDCQSHCKKRRERIQKFKWNFMFIVPQNKLKSKSGKGYRILELFSCILWIQANRLQTHTNRHRDLAQWTILFYYFFFFINFCMCKLTTAWFSVKLCDRREFFFFNAVKNESLKHYVYFCSASFL